ncbi:hypothetical protein [Nostocoides vanveenii]|uniref:hypothetical protein n=1 Tax=Nostocoides vanveenii TaxID=330835 RepID=UPI0031D228A4
MRRAKIMADLVAGGRGHFAGAETTSLQALRGWQAAIGLAVGLGAVDANGWGRTHRWANPPRDPDLMDRLLRAVEPLVAAADPAAAADVLYEWLQNAGIRSPHANTFGRITQPSAALRPVIDELLGRHGRVHIVIQRRLVANDGLPLDATGWGVDDIPQLVWPCALPDHLRESTRPDQRILRAVVSMILVRMCSDAKDWVEAGAALGFPPDKSRNWTRYAFADKWDRKGDLLGAARHLEGHLAHQPSLSRFRHRGDVSGFGPSGLKEAQSPQCKDERGNWCPCRCEPTTSDSEGQDHVDVCAAK